MLRGTGNKQLRVACLALCAAGILGLTDAASATESRETNPEQKNSAQLRLTIQKDGQLLTLLAKNVGVQRILDEISRQTGLQVVQFTALDNSLSVEVEEQPLPHILSRLLQRNSYQLYQPQSEDPILWVFSEGQSVSQADHLQAMLLHSDIRARRNAVIALRKRGSSDAVGALSFALTDVDRSIRIRAIYALAAIGGDNAVVALASAGADEDPWVRGEAAAALASIGTEESVSHLGLTLRDPDRNVRVSVIAALADVPNERSAGALALALQDPDPLLRLEAIESLEEIGGDMAIRVLREASSRQDADVKFAIAETLGMFEKRD